MSFDITAKEVFAVMKGRVNDAIKRMESLRREIAAIEGQIISSPSFIHQENLGSAGKLVAHFSRPIIRKIDELMAAALELEVTGSMMVQIHANDGEEKTEAKAAPAEDHVAERGDAEQAAEGS